MVKISKKITKEGKDASTRGLNVFNKIVRSGMLAALPLVPVTMKPMASLISSLLNTLLAIAAGMAILFLIIGGIRYLRSWGDTEQMEKAKKMVTYVVIGLVIILISYSVIVTVDKIIK